jgi:hypothetical protein
MGSQPSTLKIFWGQIIKDNNNTDRLMGSQPSTLKIFWGQIIKDNNNTDRLMGSQPSTLKIYSDVYVVFLTEANCFIIIFNYLTSEDLKSGWLGSH